AGQRPPPGTGEGGAPPRASPVRRADGGPCHDSGDARIGRHRARRRSRPYPAARPRGDDRSRQRSRYRHCRHRGVKRAPPRAFAIIRPGSRLKSTDNSPASGRWQVETCPTTAGKWGRRFRLPTDGFTANRNEALMRHIPRFTIIAAALLLGAATYCQTLPSGVQKVTSVEGITEYAYPNGLHVLLFPDTSKPKVTVNITYLVGSRQEGYGETGMAHLLEHLMFRETKTRTNIKKELTDHGAQMNGTTAWDRTNYFETVNATDEILHKEMTVVRNEFEAGENNPVNMMFQRLLETAYLWHAYGHLPIGNRSDIEHVPIERLAAFYHKYYQPDDAVLTSPASSTRPRSCSGWRTRSAVIRSRRARWKRPTRSSPRRMASVP